MASESVYASEGDQASGSTNGPLDDHTLVEDVLPANPYLKQPKLFLSDLDPSIGDKELASSVFSACLPVRLHIDRSGSDEAGNDSDANTAPAARRLSGSVEFQTLEKAELAYATIRSPRLSINENALDDPKPNAKPRLIKQLPHGTEDSDVYDLFRTYGALHGATRILTHPAGHHTGFRGMALVVYYEEQDAQRAQTEMHCAEVEQKTISVTLDNVARRPSGQGTTFSPSAAPFVPGGGAALASGMSAGAPAFHPPRSPSTSPHTYAPSSGSASASTFAVPGTNLQYSTTAATYVDPCNLFCKSLDPKIDSNALFALFKSFGKIVSARVMRDERGVSREFGFVSFRHPADASRALKAMNGTQYGNKQMIVRLHEPKNLRQEKLSHKFGPSYVMPDSSNDSGEQGSEANAGIDSPPETRPRRMSDSYFRAAASGENGQVDLQQLQSMNTMLRGDILRGGFSRKVKERDDVKASEVDELVLELSKLRLPDAVGALNDSAQLTQRIEEIRQGARVDTGNGSDGSAATGALGLPVHAPAGDAVSTHSTVGPAGTTERDRLLKAVKDVVPSGSPVEDIADLLAGLPKKERAMALFNQDYLRSKVDEAKTILELAADDDDEDDKAKDAVGNGANRGSRVEAEKTYTLADLAKMSALEIVQLAGNPQSAGLPLPKADATVVQETDAFIDSLKDLPPQDQKQKLGDRLYKRVRGFGFKGAPKISIALLDKEDLRSLAHLMNSYPDCLREKVTLMAGGPPTK